VLGPDGHAHRIEFPGIAIETMKKGLELFPEDSFMRSLKERTGNAQGQGDSSSKNPS